MALSSLSNFWTTHRPTSPPRARIPVVVPAFSYTDLEWLGASRVLFEVDYALTSRITLAYPVATPAGADFMLAVRLSDGTRYKLYDHADGVLHYPIYAGQLLTTSFTIEIWSVDSSTATLSSALDIPSNSTELDICYASTASTEYTGTTDTTIFGLLDTASGDPDIILPFEEAFPLTAATVPDAPVLSGVLTPPNSVTLTWTDVGGETGYKLYRSNDGVTYYLLTTLSHDVTTYVDTFSSSSGFYYKIRAYNSVGNSAYSNVVNVVTSFTAYYGRNTSTTVNSSDVLAMTAVTQSGPAGIYSVGAGAGYIYFAFPTTEPAPATMRVGAFDFVLETSGTYSNVTNGLNWAAVTVSGSPYRVYRSYNTLAGSLNITIS